MADPFQDLLKRIAQVESNFPLGSFNILGAGGVADYFTAPQDTIELAAAVQAALDQKMPYLVIGQGRGLLFSDGGFPGLVIHNQSSNLVFSSDHSQVVADSGLSLKQFISVTSSRGLGGLTHLYSEPGTIGGAVYANLQGDGGPILSSVRFLTMLVPPSLLDKRATIIRYPAEWLKSEEGRTKLQVMKETKLMEEPQPIILTVTFQLTRLRPDELQNRMQIQSGKHPEPEGFGPVFEPIPGDDLDHLLVRAGVASLRKGEVYPDRYHPNYLVSSQKSVRATDVRQLIIMIEGVIKKTYGITLRSRFEYAGVW